MNQREQIEKLTVGYSGQAKISNQFWLAMIVTCIVSLVGRIEKGLIELPFALGTVEPNDFYLIINLLITVLIIAFTSALIQTMRTRILIQRAIDSMDKKEKVIGEIHIQDFVDSTLTQTYSRVAPISQFVLGKKQFLGDGKPNSFVLLFGTILYITLKITSFILVYILPIYSLIYSNLKIRTLEQTGTISIPYAATSVFNVIALICIIILLVGNFLFLLKAFKRIWSK